MARLLHDKPLQHCYALHLDPTTAGTVETGIMLIVFVTLGVTDCHPCLLLSVTNLGQFHTCEICSTVSAGQMQQRGQSCIFCLTRSVCCNRNWACMLIAFISSLISCQCKQLCTRLLCVQTVLSLKCAKWLKALEATRSVHMIGARNPTKSLRLCLYDICGRHWHDFSADKHDTQAVEEQACIKHMWATSNIGPCWGECVIWQVCHVKQVLLHIIGCCRDSDPVSELA